MSENLHDIEDLFYDSIEGHQEMPPNSVWDNIDHKLDKKSVALANKKYNRLRRLAAVLLFFLLGTITYEVLTKTGHIKGQKNTVVNSNSKNEPIESAAAKPGIIITKDNKKPQDIQIAKAKSNSLLNANSVIKPSGAENSKYLKDSVNTASPGNSKLLIPGREETRIAITNRNLNPDNTALKLTDNNALYNNNIVSARAYKNAVPEARKKSPPGKVEFSKSLTATGIDKKQQTGFDAAALTENGIYNSENNKNTLVATLTQRQNSGNNRPAMITPPAHEKISFTVTISEDRINRRIASKPGAAVIALKKNVPPFHFTLTPFLGPQFNFNHIVGDDDHRNNRPMQNDLDDIKKGESDKSSYSLGVLMGIHLKKKWSLETGISYINKSVEIEPKKIYADLDNGAVKYRFDFSSGYTYLSPKTTGTPVVGDSILATASSSNLQYIAIPLTLNYTFLKGKFNIIPSAGAGVNFLIKEKMSTNILTGTSNEKQNITSIQGLKKIYFNAIGGVAFQYNASKKISVTINPSASFALGPINKTAAVKSYPNSFNLTAGIKIYF